MQKNSDFNHDLICDNCKSEVEVANFDQRYSHLKNVSQGIDSKMYGQFRDLRHIRPVKKTPHFLDDDMKIKYLVIIRDEVGPELANISQRNNLEPIECKCLVQHDGTTLDY